MMLKKVQLFLFIFITSSTFMLSQSDTMLLIHSYKKEEGVRLKWLPASATHFALGTKNGYNLYKAPVTLQSGSPKLGEYVKLNSEPIKPWTSEAIDKLIKTDSNYALLNGYLEYAKIHLNTPASDNLADAREAVDNEEYFSFFASLAILQSNIQAEALGTYFVDKSANTSAKYMYKLVMIGNEKYTDYLLCDLSKPDLNKPIANFTATLNPKRVQLKWYNNHNKDYVAYNVYRAEKKNGPFKQLNEIPFMNSGGPASKDENYTYYYDSIPEYGKTYYYKVQGLNGFEELGLATEIKSITTNYLLEYGAEFTEGIDIGKEGVLLQWQYNKEELPYVKHFNLYRANNPSGPYGQVNTKPILNKEREFVDNTPKGSSNYYVLFAYGTSGDSISSIIKSVLLIDSIPPDMPKFDKITCDTNGVVTIKWFKNKEPDLHGYRIFKTYDRGLDAERVNQDFVKDTIFTDSVDLKLDHSKIYYRLYAFDQHFNPSTPTKYYEVILPDKVPPSNAYFTVYSSGMKGIDLNWQKSSSLDLEKTILYRKSEMDFQYYAIKEFKGDSIDVSHYLDTNVKAKINYSYILQTQDLSGLKSEKSKELNIQMLDNKKIPSVTNLKAIVSRENRMIKLTWDLNANALGYKVYRAENGGDLETYTMINGNVREFYDKMLKTSTKYTYMIVAELPDNIKSGYSNKVSFDY